MAEMSSTNHDQEKNCQLVSEYSLGASIPIRELPIDRAIVEILARHGYVETGVFIEEDDEILLQILDRSQFDQLRKCIAKLKVGLGPPGKERKQKLIEIEAAFLWRWGGEPPRLWRFWRGMDTWKRGCDE